MGTKGQLRTDRRTSSAVHQALRPRFTTTPTILTRQEVHPEKAGARSFPLLPRVPESLVIQPTFSAAPAPGEEGLGEGAAAHSTGGGGQEGAVEKLPGACSRRFSGAGPPPTRAGSVGKPGWLQGTTASYGWWAQTAIWIDASCAPVPG